MSLDFIDSDVRRKRDKPHIATLGDISPRAVSHATPMRASFCYIAIWTDTGHQLEG